MSIHSLDRQRLQNFVGLYLEGGVKRASVLKHIVRLFSRISPGKLPFLLPRFESLFAKTFHQFRSAKGIKLRVRMKKAITNLNKELNDLEPMERETFVSISVYLLMTTLFNGAIGVQPSKRVEAMEPVSIAV